MKFLKMQGSGNDFVLVDARESGERDWSKVARAMCDRHYGVGSDGLLLVYPSKVADFRMVMYNPDGSESEMCGNGIRCFAKYLYDTGLTGGARLTADTGAGILPLEIEADDGVARRVVVDMGVPAFNPLRIPVAVEAPEVVDLRRTYLDRELKLTAVSMGNPHAVHFAESDPREFPLERIGPLVEHDLLFPRRVNFEVARAVSAHRIEARVWERGAGITLACGTGACATFAAARRKGLVGDHATVALPGGELDMRLGPSGQILMAGPAELVFVGEWPE